MLFHSRQRGAVTLMGALFIVLVVALLAQNVNRMAGSTITDTAAQSDTVEALFVVESGIEFASFMYTNGTACVDLATAINTTAAGRGFFDVTNALLVGTDCRITVQGRVSSIGAAAPGTALRTVSADLRLASGGGWAIGDNGSILRWDGVNWSAVASNTTENLYSVHCVRANDCWAAGGSGVILHWNGSVWSVPLPSGTTGTLQGISCAPLMSNHCYANGAVPIVFGSSLQSISRYWDGIGWNGGGVNLGLDVNDYYSDITCPSSNCFSTTGAGLVRQSSTSWGSVFSGSIALNGIDCAASDQCWAVGNLSGNSYYFVRNNGGSWSVQTVPAANNVRSNLNAVSCAAVDDCWAVGDVGSGRYVLVHWNGTSWSSNAFQNGQHRDNLNGVDCASANDCWAVGDQQNGWNLIHYDGVSWSYVGSSAANTANLNDVYLHSTDSGGVSLVRWRELISN